LRKYVEYLAEEKELIDSKTLKRMKKSLNIPHVKDKFIDPLPESKTEEVFRIARGRSSRDYALFLVTYEGCLRRREVLELKVSDINFKDQQVKVDGIKREDDRIINVSKRCIEALKDYVDNHRGEPLPKYKDCLFLNYEWKLSKNALYTLHKEYKLLAKLPEDFTFHGWRHTGCTHITKKALRQTKGNIPLTLKILQSQTGHKDINVLLEKYVSIYQSEVKEFYNNIWESNNERESQPEKPKHKPQPKPQDSYIANVNQDPDIRIKELELELLKLKQQKQQRDDLRYYG
jgi:integrase